jgi:hypothetical protein
VSYGGVLIWILGLIGVAAILFTIAPRIRHEKSHCYPVSVFCSASSGWPSKEHADFEAVPILEYIPIKDHPLHIIGKIQRLDFHDVLKRFRTYCRGCDVFSLWRNNRYSSWQPFFRRRDGDIFGIGADASVNPRPYAIARCLAPVFYVKLPFKQGQWGTITGSTIRDFHACLIDTQIGSQLLFGCLLGQRIGLVGSSYRILGGLRLSSDCDQGSRRKNPLAAHFNRLLFDKENREDADNYTAEPNQSQCEIDPKRGFIVTILGWGRDDPYISVNVLLMFGLEGWAVVLFCGNRRSRAGWLIAFGGLLCLVRLGVSLHREDEEKEREYCQQLQHNGVIVPQKYLDFPQLLGYIYSSEASMANILSTDKKIAVIGALAEGSSIRSIERITGVHRDTIMRLGVKVGQGCTALMDTKMRNLPASGWRWMRFGALSARKSVM